MTLLPLTVRKRRIMEHPRVEYHVHNTPCTALAASRDSGKCYQHKDPAMREAARKRAACRSTAHWIFTSLEGQVHDYCWQHLISFGFGSMKESDALERWWTQKYGRS